MEVTGNNVMELYSKLENIEVMEGMELEGPRKVTIHGITTHSIEGGTLTASEAPAPLEMELITVLLRFFATNL
ncbi:UNVERIFIED_CONTAM: hypothetical protein Sradi_0204100 [Sesamum radiatum]|uniref:Uncharacterized protein n=1 Tax=Sesamum radiatum TaxID=300843 RepID=A0AAW2W040_SESRA